MRKALITCLLLLFMVHNYAQETKYDSLKSLVREATDDSTRFLSASSLIWEYLYSIPDSAEAYIQSNILLAKKMKSDRALSTVYYQYAGLEQLNGNYPAALQYGFLSLRAAERTKNLQTIASSYFNLGDIYREAGDIEQAIDNLQKAKSMILSEINPVVAEEKLSRYVYTYALCITLLTQAFEKSNQPDSAMAYIKIVENLHEKRLSTDPFFPRILSFIKGNLSLRAGEYAAALSYYRTGAAMSISQDVKKDIMDNYNGEAMAFNKMGQLDSAIFYAKVALQIGTKVRNISGKLEAFTLLAEVYTSKQQADSMAKYLALTMATKDSLFNQQKVMRMQSFAFNEELREQEIKDKEEEYKNKLRMYVLAGGLVTLLIVAGILFRSNRHKQKAKIKIENAYKELKATQQQLIQSEKMASLGELTAGIAHEIQNPLNFVNNFSEVNAELLQDMKTEIDKGNFDEVKIIAQDVIENGEKINHHGKRAESIVKGMLQHSRTNTGHKELTAINALADEYLRLSYHGIRAKDKNFNATIQIDFDESIGNINIIPQDIGRVLLNLYNNAFYAVNEKKKSVGDSYEPTVSVSTKKAGDKVIISVKDNGNGIPQTIVDKIFQPFFTTKPTGQGTGLGLSLAYDIVKAHGGDISVVSGKKVETKDSEGTEFIIQLPIV